jgi:nucleoid-associated protein YgaU
MRAYAGTRNGEAVMGRSSAVLVGWVGALVLGVVAGHALGSGVLAVPGAEVAAWRSWAAATDPLVMTMAILRLVLVAGAWYLLATTVLGVAARALRAVRLVRLADAVSAPVVRRLVQRGTGVMVATAIAASAAAPTVRAAEPPPPPSVNVQAPGVVTMRGLASTPPPEGDGDRDGGSTAALPWQWFGDRASGAEGRSAPMPSDESPVRGVAPGEPVEADALHTVQPGESLWRIAEHHLEAAWGRPPRDAEVVPYWRDVIERNRDRLVVADDPDLILPGQVLVLPTVVAP